MVGYPSSPDVLLRAPALTDVLRVKAKGRGDEVTVVGPLPSATAGEWLVADA